MTNRVIKKIFSWSKFVPSGAVCALLIIASVFVLYLGTLDYPFVWDDEEIVLQNSLIKDWQNFGEMLKSDVWGGSIENGNFYRPLQTFSYSLDYAMWGFDAQGYRIINIALHAASAVLVFVIFMGLGIRKNWAALGALIFAIHPVNIESVTYISGRGDAMFLFFSLLCFFLFLKGARLESKNIEDDARGLNRSGSRGKIPVYYISCVLFFVLAIFSKESAIAMPFIIAAYYAFFLRGHKKRGAFLASGALLALALAYAAARFAIMGIEGAAALSIVSEATLQQRVLTLPRTIITYISLLAFPRNLHMEYLFMVEQLRSAWVWLGAPFILAIIFACLKYIKPRKTSLFFLAWFFLGLGPFYNIFPALSSSLREHWTYLSEIGFIGLAVLMFSMAWRNNKKYIRQIIAIAIACVAGYYAFATMDRNKDWSDPARLYAHDAKFEPQSFLLHNNLGVEYFRQGKIKKAKQSFLDAIAAAPRGAYDVAHNNLGAVLEKKGDLEGAIEEYKKSTQIGDYYLGYKNLGSAYLKKGMPKKARKILEQGAKIHPRNLSINYYLGVAYFEENRFVKARDVFEAIENSSPGYEDTQYYLNEIYKK